MESNPRKTEKELVELFHRNAPDVEILDVEAGKFHHGRMSDGTVVRLVGWLRDAGLV